MRKCAAGAVLRYFPARVKQELSADFERRWRVRLLYAGNVLVSRVYHRVEVLRPPRLPQRGPAILVCNHVSALDPLLIQSVCRRVVTWMMASEYYDAPGIGWVFRTVEAIPVDRSGRDLTATRAALRALAAGRIVGIFPEGRIETDHELLPFQTGVALMAIKTRVPVYPAYLDGTQRGKEMVPALLIPNQARLAFGPAVEFARSSTSREALEQATEKIRIAVEDLKQECGAA